MRRRSSSTARATTAAMRSTRPRPARAGVCSDARFRPGVRWTL